MKKIMIGVVVFAALACAIMVNAAVAVGIAHGPGHVIESLVWGAFFWGNVAAFGALVIAFPESSR